MLEKPFLFACQVLKLGELGNWQSSPDVFDESLAMTSTGQLHIKVWGREVLNVLGR